MDCGNKPSDLTEESLAEAIKEFKEQRLGKRLHIEPTIAILPPDLEPDAEKPS